MPPATSWGGEDHFAMTSLPLGYAEAHPEGKGEVRTPRQDATDQQSVGEDSRYPDLLLAHHAYLAQAAAFFWVTVRVKTARR